MRLTILAALLVAISGCGIVYKQDIQQGNVLDPDDVEQLRPGMTKRQVTVLLGTPSVSSPFHEDRWDYTSTFAPRGGSATKRHLSIRFENDQVVSIEGDYLAEADLTDDALEAMQAEQEEEAIDDALRRPPTPTDNDTPGPVPPPDQ